MGNDPEYERTQRERRARIVAERKRRLPISDTVVVPRALIDRAWSLLLQGGGRCCHETSDALYPFTTAAARSAE